MVDDAELLRRYAAERSEAAFAELVQRHLDLVYSAALRRLGGDAHAAADVAQQVFTALARQTASLTRCAVLPGWLYATTRNVAVDYIRAEHRRRARELEAHTMHELTSTPPSDAAWEQMRPVLDEVMDELSAADREIVVLRFFARRPFAAIGAALNVSEDAARMRVDRALDKLRVLLARRQITSTTAALALVLANQSAVAVPASLAASVTSSALVSASAAAPVVSIFQIMSTSKIAVSVAGVLLAAALGTVTYEGRVRQAAEDSLAAATGEVARLDGRLREMQQSVVMAEQALNNARSSLAATEAPAAKPPPAAAVARDPVAAGNEFLARHPEARQLIDELKQAGYAAKLVPAFRLMHLNQETQDQIVTLFLRADSGPMSLSSSDGMSMSLTVQREPTLTSAEVQTQIQNLFGADDYKHFQALMRMTSSLDPTFDLTGQLAGALYRTDPLSQDQMEQVIQIFTAARLAARGTNPNGPAALDWNVVSTEACSVLSAAQLAALTGVQQTFEYQQAMKKLWRSIPDAAASPKNSNPASR